MKKRELAILLAFAAGCATHDAELPPHGEALFVVDTDLPVPQLASRLRVDVYSEDGVWLDSRDIGRSDRLDWPSSFSVFSDDDSRERRALVRMRVYPEGSVEPYSGEANAPRATYAEPHAAADVADLCSSAPLLPLGGRVSQRLGRAPLVQHASTSSCSVAAQSGAVAARVVIPTKGSYRFSVAGAAPYLTWLALSLRTACDDATTQTSCATEQIDRGATSPGHFPRFDATLDPGTYTLLATGLLPDWPADVTLEALALDGEAPLPPTPSPPAPAPALPRLAPAGVDRTPETVPAAPATVDRLVLVRLVPGVRGSVRVTLHGACAGMPSILGRAPGAIDLEAATTCVDADPTPLTETALSSDFVRTGASVAGTFPPPAPCPLDDPANPRVCIPGGAFLFGSRTVQASGFAALETTPERIAVMPRFQLDRYEVTVGRLRDAIARGLEVDPALLHPNANALPPTFDPRAPPQLDAFCTWSAQPQGREDMPVNCVAWSVARAFCTFGGGDLPTEAEWEYAAAAAGRPFKTRYPWGDEDAQCERGIFGRLPPPLGVACPGAALGPASVLDDQRAGRLPDLSPQGVSGLDGSVGEWTLDASRGLADPCWKAAGVVSPRCWEENALWRTVRGSNWSGLPGAAMVRAQIVPSLTGHEIAGVTIADATIGFRCAYHEASR